MSRVRQGTHSAITPRRRSRCCAAIDQTDAQPQSCQPTAPAPRRAHRAVRPSRRWFRAPHSRRPASEPTIRRTRAYRARRVTSFANAEGGDILFGIEAHNRLRALHLEAVDTAVRGELPIGLGDYPTAIVSLIPTTLFRQTRDLEIAPGNALAPNKPAGRIDAVRMIEGVLLHSISGDPQAVRSYAITHRQGRTDMVCTVGRVVVELRNDAIKLVWPKKFEDSPLDAAISGAAKLSPFGIEEPWLVLVTVVGIKDHHRPRRA